MHLPTAPTTDALGQKASALLEASARAHFGSTMSRAAAAPLAAGIGLLHLLTLHLLTLHPAPYPTAGPQRVTP